MLALVREIKTLDLSSCNLGVSDYSLLLPTLLSEAIVVKELNLTVNCLGRMKTTLLKKVFDALFELPQLETLSLDLSDNQLTPHHFSLMYASWKNKSSDKKLKHFAFGGNYCNDDTICKAMAMNVH